MSAEDSRRRLLLAGLASAALGVSSVPARRALAQTASAPAAGTHGSVGAVRPPRPSPSLRLVRVADGSPLPLAELLRGKVTALQLMFTGCSATCPIQGALFQELQGLIAGEPADFALLSVGIDPLGDDRAAMLRWLNSFGARPARWSGAIGSEQAIESLLGYLNGRSLDAERHTPQVYVFDRQGRLCFRSPDLPATRLVAGVMRKVAEATAR
jgi:protein SCO1/2